MGKKAEAIINAAFGSIALSGALPVALVLCGTDLTPLVLIRLPEVAGCRSHDEPESLTASKPRGSYPYPYP